MPKVKTLRASEATKTKTLRASASTKTIEQAHDLLAKGFVTKRDLNGFVVAILRDLCNTKSLQVAVSGKSGHPIKPDFVNALVMNRPNLFLLTLTDLTNPANPHRPHRSCRPSPTSPILPTYISTALTTLSPLM